LQAAQQSPQLDVPATTAFSSTPTTVYTQVEQQTSQSESLMNVQSLQQLITQLRQELDARDTENNELRAALAIADSISLSTTENLPPPSTPGMLTGTRDGLYRTEQLVASNTQQAQMLTTMIEQRDRRITELSDVASQQRQEIEQLHLDMKELSDSHSTAMQAMQQQIILTERRYAELQSSYVHMQEMSEMNCHVEVPKESFQSDEVLNTTNELTHEQRFPLYQTLRRFTSCLLMGDRKWTLGAVVGTLVLLILYGVIRIVRR